MTERSAIFLDFDGTYADRGIAPPGHVSAVRAARQAGNMVLLCTGRPRSMLPDHIRSGFDGIVAAAGGYVEVDGEVLLDTRFPAGLAATVVRVLDSHDVGYVLEAPEAVYGLLGVDERLRSAFAGHFTDAPEQGGGLEDILANLRTSDDLTGISFGKVTLFDSPVPVTALVAEIGDGVGALPSSVQAMGDSVGEIYLLGVHKAGGMEVVAERCGLERRQLVAFGDGLNDLEMLEHAGVSVAIEGSPPELLAVADHIAAGPEKEGLAEAFAALGLT